MFTVDSVPLSYIKKSFVLSTNTKRMTFHYVLDADVFMYWSLSV